MAERRTDEAKHFLQECEQKTRIAWQLCQEHNLIAEETVLRQLATVLFLQKDYLQARAAFQECLNLAKRKSDLWAQQSSLEALGRSCLELKETESARKYYQEALELFEKRRYLLAAEELQILFAQQGIAIYQRLLQIYLEQDKTDIALEVVEQAKSRAFLNLLGTSQLHRPPISKTLGQREEECLIEVRGIVVSWRSTSQEDVATRNRLWSRWIQVQRKLEQVWNEMEQDQACAEYVALRRGTSTIEFTGAKQILITL